MLPIFLNSFSFFFMGLDALEPGGDPPQHDVSDYIWRAGIKAFIVTGDSEPTSDDGYCKTGINVVTSCRLQLEFCRTG
jgi:hypothetical protein